MTGKTDSWWLVSSWGENKSWPQCQGRILPKSCPKTVINANKACALTNSIHPGMCGSRSWQVNVDRVWVFARNKHVEMLPFCPLLAGTNSFRPAKCYLDRMGNCAWHRKNRPCSDHGRSTLCSCRGQIMTSALSHLY